MARDTFLPEKVKEFSAAIQANYVLKHALLALLDKGADDGWVFENHEKIEEWIIKTADPEWWRGMMNKYE